MILYILSLTELNMEGLSCYFAATNGVLILYADT